MHPTTKNVSDRRRWNTREELAIAIVTWIGRTYRRCGRQAALVRFTPIAFQAIATNTLSHADVFGEVVA